MKNKFLYFLMMIGLVVTLTACGSGDDGDKGDKGDTGDDGTLAAECTLEAKPVAYAPLAYGDDPIVYSAPGDQPDDTYFSIAITDNSHHHVGDNLVYVDFVTEGETATTPASGTTNDWVTAMHVNDMTGPMVLDGDISDWSGHTTTVKGVALEGNYNATDYDISDRDITVGVAYDDAYIYMVASWTDVTQSYQGRDRYEYTAANDPPWAKSTTGAYHDEDRLFVVWPITDGEGAYAAGGTGCLTYCHTAPKVTADASASVGSNVHMAMNTPGDRIDTWHWKSVRNDPIGVLDDKHWIVASYNADTKKPVNGRKSDVGRGANASISLNACGNPTLVHYSGPSATYPVEGLLEFDVIPYASALIAGYTPTDGDVTPRYMNTQPSGSFADVEVKSGYADGAWTVEIRRLRLTGDPGDDYQFTGGGTDATAPTDGADVAVVAVASPAGPAACTGCHATGVDLTNVAAGLLYAAPGNASGDGGQMTDQTAITAQQAVDYAAALKSP